MAYNRHYMGVNLSLLTDCGKGEKKYRVEVVQLKDVLLE